MPRSYGPMLAVLMLLSSGCVPSSAPLLPTPLEPPKPAQVPPMPDSARQPPRPPECSPSCLDDATTEAERARSTLTALRRPASAASAGPTR